MASRRARWVSIGLSGALAGTLLGLLSCRIGGNVVNTALHSGLTTLSWTFNDSANYVFDPTRIVFGGGAASLASTPQTDSSSGAIGFGGGTASSTGFECLNNGLALAGPAPLALPNNGSTGGWLNMSGNVLLLHLDENSWSGAGQVLDSSGNAFNGTAVGATPICGGRISRGGLFDGSSSYIDLGNAPFSTATAATISAWIYMTSTPSADGHHYDIVAKSGFAHDFDLQVETDNKVHFYLSTSTGNTVASSAVLLPNQWYHVVATYQQGASIQLYVNGVLSGTQAITGSWAGNSNSLYVGASKVWTGRNFRGVIDEVAIWNVALSGAQVSTIYANQASLPPASGSFDSRVMDAGAPVSWSSLSWTPLRPSNKPLPNGGLSESAYSLGNANMSGNVMLLHMDEASWSGAGQVLDSSGNGFNGTATSAVSAAGGRFNRCGSFNGTSTYVDFGNVPFSTASAATVSAWVWLNSTPSVDGHFYDIFAKSGSGADFDLQIETDNKLHFYVYTTGVNNAASSATLTSGQWYHLAATYQQGSSLQLYINGAPAGSLPITGAWIGNSGTLRVGNSAVWAGRFLNGNVDEVAVWNRALGATEVNDLYLRGATRLRFQVRSCSSPSCAATSYVGPDGTGGTYFSELGSASPSLPSPQPVTLANNRYFQYRAYLDSDTTAYSPELLSVAAGPAHIDASSPQLVSGNGLSFSQVTGFAHTLAPGSTGSIQYQLSPDGATWYYYNGSAWVSAGSAAQSNSVDIINANIGAFLPESGGAALFFKAFLISNGSQPLGLQSVSATGIR